MKNDEHTEMMDSDPDPSFLRNFLERWQKLSMDHVAYSVPEVNSLISRLAHILGQMKEVTDFRPVLEEMLDAGIAAIQAERASLLLRDGDGKLRVVLSRGAYASDQALSGDQEVIQRVMRSRESVCFSDPHESTARTLLEQNFRWFLPVIAANQFHGVLYFEGKESRESADNFCTAQMLAELAADAVSRSHLLQQKENALAHISRLQQKVVYYDRLAMRGKLAGPIGHELNNLLAIFSSHLDLLKNDLAAEEHIGSFSQRLSALTESMQNAQRLVKGLTGFSTVDTLLQRCSADRLVTDFVEFTRPLFDKSGAVLCVKLDSGGSEVMADAEQIRQVLYILVKNAIKRKHDAVVTIRTVHRAEESRIKIHVNDDGPGMSRETLQRLFAPTFAQKEDTFSVGWFICREIVERHKGALSADCAPDSGCEFVVSLPVIEDKKPVTE